MRRYQCLSAADIHGNKDQYKKIKSIVAHDKVDFVFLCGDLLPKTGGTWTLDNKIRTIQMQRDFIEDFFVDYLRDLGKIAHVYAIFGNDDFKSNYDLVSSLNIPQVTFLCNEVVALPIKEQDFYVAGYPYVGLTPFLHKDWEKWDEIPKNMINKVYRSDGYTSKNGKHIAVDLAMSNETIANDLSVLEKQSDPARTIYVFHEAPYDTALDMIAPGNKYIKDGELHIGSIAMRKFIETKQPLMTMHGHIHETFAESGRYIEKIGNSISITASNDFSSDILSIVRFSLPDLSDMQRQQFQLVV